MDDMKGAREGGGNPRVSMPLSSVAYVQNPMGDWKDEDLGSGQMEASVPMEIKNMTVIQDFRDKIGKPPTVDAGFKNEMAALLRRLPQALNNALLRVCRREKLTLAALNEIYLQLGHRGEVVFDFPPAAIFSDRSGKQRRVMIARSNITMENLALFRELFEANELAMDSKRVGIPGTLHRLSVITHPATKPQKVIGVAARVGRVVTGIVRRMAPSVIFDSKKSLLLIGRPGVGKTTVLRELARILSEQTEERSLNVIVVDKTCEIGGAGLEPHYAIGSARWMPVGKPGMQARIMLEAVENQSPHVIIVDEISTAEEVNAARTIAQRGVRLIATVHGTNLAELINCNERGTLLGGQTNVTLTDKAASMRRDKRKTVPKRRREPVFEAALELQERERWIYHPDTISAVDSYYEGVPVAAEEFRPGLRVAIAAVPENDSHASWVASSDYVYFDIVVMGGWQFQYSYECRTVFRKGRHKHHANKGNGDVGSGFGDTSNAAEPAFSESGSS
eukprot:jgi/Bigna1/82641/fgenesh1_pg.95_\